VVVLRHQDATAGDKLLPVSQTTARERSEKPTQSWIGDGDRVGPGEPRGVLALIGRRTGVVAGRPQHIPQVEMGVSAGPVVHVDVHDGRRESLVLAPQARLLTHLSEGGVGRFLAWVDVTARLEPQSQALVAVQQHPAITDDHCGARDVRRVGVLVERPAQLAERPQDRHPRPRLAVIHRRDSRNLRAHPREPPAGSLVLALAL
jgi:hypothetical protein